MFGMSSKEENDMPIDILKSMSIDEICRFIDCYVTNGEMSSRLIGLIRSGHECRNTLLSLCPSSDWAEEVIDNYDYFWLGSPK